MGTASAQLDRRIDFTGTLALLESTFPSPTFPVGTWTWVTDFGFVNWNGSSWATANPGTIAANATITQAAGTLVASELCNVTSAAAGAITLPPSVGGLMITIHNISANNVSVFPSAAGTGTEKINALAANAAIVMATNTSASFTCAVAGQWYTVPRVPS